jgi:protein SCO1/2
MRALFVIIACVVMLVPAAARASGVDPAAIAIVDQRGMRFSLSTLPKRHVAVTFVASRCADACPIANALFARMQRRIVAQHLPLGLVTITLDPAFDTPFVMSALAGTFGAQPATWRVCSGSVTDIRRLMQAFGVVARPDAMGIPEVHSSEVYLLDEHRRLEKILLLGQTLPDDLAAAIGVPASRTPSREPAP